MGEDLLAGGSGGDGDDDDAGSAALAPPLMILLPFLAGEAYAPPSAAPAMDPSSRIPLGVPRLRNRSRRFARRPHLFLIHLRLPPPPGRTVRAVLAARRERSATATAAVAQGPERSHLAPASDADATRAEEPAAAPRRRSASIHIPSSDPPPTAGAADPHEAHFHGGEEGSEDMIAPPHPRSSTPRWRTSAPARRRGRTAMGMPPEADTGPAQKSGEEDGPAPSAPAPVVKREARPRERWSRWREVEAEGSPSSVAAASAGRDAEGCAGEGAAEAAAALVAAADADRDLGFIFAFFFLGAGGLLAAGPWSRRFLDADWDTASPGAAAA